MTQRSSYSIFVLATAALVLSSCMPAAGKVEACRRKFDDEQVEKILTKHLDLSSPHRTKIYWSDCRYDIVVWSVPAVPDSQVLVTLDANGNLVSKEH